MIQGGTDERALEQLHIFTVSDNSALRRSSVCAVGRRARTIPEARRSRESISPDASLTAAERGHDPHHFPPPLGCCAADRHYLNSSLRPAAAARSSRCAWHLGTVPDTHMSLYKSSSACSVLA